MISKLHYRKQYSCEIASSKGIIWASNRCYGPQSWRPHAVGYSPRNLNSILLLFGEVWKATRSNTCFRERRSKHGQIVCVWDSSISRDCLPESWILRRCVHFCLTICTVPSWRFPFMGIWAGYLIFCLTRTYLQLQAAIIFLSKDKNPVVKTITRGLSVCYKYR